MIDGPACAEKTNFAASLDGAIHRMHRKLIYNVHQQQKEQSNSTDHQAITKDQSWQYIVCCNIFKTWQDRTVKACKHNVTYIQLSGDHMRPIIKIQNGSSTCRRDSTKRNTHTSTRVLNNKFAVSIAYLRVYVEP